MITIKNEKEIEALKEGGKRLRDMLRELALLAVPGNSTQLFEDKTREIIGRYGDKAAIYHYTPAGARRPYPASVCISINDEIVHGIPNEHARKLKEGDIVTIDSGLVHQGMYVDSAITVPVGVVSSDALRLIKATREALTAGIAEAKVGKTIGDIGAAIAKVASDYGYRIAEDLCGHGVGFGVHEDPFVPNYGTPGTGEKLRAGMVIAIEPMLVAGEAKAQAKVSFAKIKLDADGYTYRSKDGSLSAHEEHTVVITPGEPLVVTR